MSWEMEAKKEREIYLRRAIVSLLCKSCSGMRKRTIAGYVGANVMELIGLLDKMCEEGILGSKCVNDFGNMERYDLYYVKG